MSKYRKPVRERDILEELKKYVEAQFNHYHVKTPEDEYCCGLVDAYEEVWDKIKELDR